MFFMVTALSSELLIIMNLAYKRAYSYLSEDTVYYVIGIFVFTVFIIFLLVYHPPNTFYIILRMPPISFRFKVAQVKTIF